MLADSAAQPQLRLRKLSLRVLYLQYARIPRLVAFAVSSAVNASATCQAVQRVCAGKILLKIIY